MNKIAIFKARDGQITLYKEESLKNEMFMKRRNDEGDQHVLTVKEPSLTLLEKWSMDGIAKAIDGCRVEPDGSCPHGYPSWLIALGYI